MIAASFTASLLTLLVDPNISFYFPHTRAWEFVLGGLLAVLPSLGRWSGEIANLLGLLLIGLGLLMISDQQAFPGWLALLSGCGAALIIWKKPDTWTGSLLALNRGIGRISYSLYLWHWPVWSFYRLYINNGFPNSLASGILFCITITIATLSFKFVELPFRQIPSRHSSVIGVGFLSSTVVAAVAYFVVHQHGFPSRIPSKFLAMESTDKMWKWDDCKYLERLGGSLPACEFGASWNTSNTTVSQIFAWYVSVYWSCAAWASR